MDECSIDRFIADYEGDDSCIRFEWNGKHDDDFKDANEAFRSDVIDRVIAHPSDVQLKLIAGLYRALTHFSAEAWCIDDRVEALARLMINKGGPAVSRDFIIGAMESFDAQCAAVFTGAQKEMVGQCLEDAQTKLDAAKDENERTIWLFALEHFAKLRRYAT